MYGQDTCCTPAGHLLCTFQSLTQTMPAEFLWVTSRNTVNTCNTPAGCLQSTLDCNRFFFLSNLWTFFSNNQSVVCFAKILRGEEPKVSDSADDTNSPK